MTWLIAGPILGAALLLAWMWWHSCRVAAETERVEQESKKFVADAWVECLNQHQRAFTAMDPKYVGRDLIVQVDGPESQQQHVTEGQALADWERHARALDVWQRDFIAKWNREFDAHVCDSRALAEQRRLDEMEL